MHGAVQICYQIWNLSAIVKGEQAACHVVVDALATFAPALLLKQQVFRTPPSLKNILRYFVRTQALFIWIFWATSRLDTRGRCNKIGPQSSRSTRVKLSQFAPTTAIILLTRGWTCSGELDGGGSALTAVFIVAAQCLSVQFTVSLSQFVIARFFFLNWPLPGFGGS